MLAELKADDNLLAIPVVVLTTSQAEEDILRSYSLHANAYISKPVDFEKFVDVIGQIDDFFLTLVKLPTPAKDTAFDIRSGSMTTARALVSTLVPADRAVSAMATLPSSFSSTVPLTSIVAPVSSSGTTTGAEKRTPNSVTVAPGPAQSVTNRPAWAMVNMPWAMTSGRPTARATRSFQWMGLKSPEAPQYLTRLSLLTGKLTAGICAPASTRS